MSTELPPPLSLQAYWRSNPTRHTGAGRYPSVFANATPRQVATQCPPMSVGFTDGLPAAQWIPFFNGMTIKKKPPKRVVFLMQKVRYHFFRNPYSYIFGSISDAKSRMALDNSDSNWLNSGSSDLLFIFPLSLRPLKNSFISYNEALGFAP